MTLQTPLQTPPIKIEPAVKRSRFDVEPVSISLAKRFKSEPQPVTNNPLSDVDSDSMEEITVSEPQKPPTFSKKKANKSVFGEVMGTKEELQRRDRRMQRFSEIEVGATPPRVDTPDYVRDAQIAASIVQTPPLSK